MRAVFRLLPAIAWPTTEKKVPRAATVQPKAFPGK